MDLPQQKHLRLREYAYSQNGAYFITISTHNREKIFGDVGADIESAPTVSEIVQTFKRRSTIEHIKMVNRTSCPRSINTYDSGHFMTTLSAMRKAIMRYGNTSMRTH